MPFLLMVLLTVACLPDLEIQQDGSTFWPEPLLPTPFGLDPVLWSVLLTAGATLAVGVHAWWLSRRVAAPLHRDPNLRDQLLPRYERRRFFHQFGLFALLGLGLCVFGWGWAVPHFWRHGEVLLPGAELMVIAPFFAGMVLSWLFFFDADRASHQAAYRLVDLDPIARALLDPKEIDAATLAAHDAHVAQRDFGGRWTYVLFQMRQKLALVLIPLGLLLVQKEFQRRLGSIWPEWQLAINVAGCGCVLLAFLAMPWAVRLVLGLKSMPAGPLRDRLTATAKRVGFRCGDLLVWNTRSGMANAMVVGLLPWPRYVVFTDRMLEEFTPDEVEAVFGHEIGHVKHHHMLFYLLFLSLSIIVLGVAYFSIFRLFKQGPSDFEAVPLVLGLIPYVFVVFGYISRRCERQADLYGCRTVSCTAGRVSLALFCQYLAEEQVGFNVFWVDLQGECWEHDGVELAAHGEGLCPTGIQTFIRALEKVALLNGINRERPGFLQSWQHSTIAKRVAFLQRVLLDRGVERSFQRRVLWVKAGMFALLCVALTAMLLLTPAGQQ
jgi:Zn-dependent protease with chaperone function